MAYFADGPEVSVNSTYARSQYDPASCTLADGRYVIAWTDANTSTTGDRFIRAQIYNADGTVSGSELTLVSGNALKDVALTPLPGGGFAMAWSSFDVKCAQFSPTGQMLGAVTTLGYGYSVDIAASSQGIAVTWQASSASSGDTSGDSLWLRTFDPASGVWTPQKLVNTQTQQSQYAPKIISLEGGGYYVVWSDHFGEWSAKGQMIDRNGNKVGPERNFGTYSTQTYSAAVDPAVAQLADGSIVVAWSDSSPDGSVTIARRYGLDGAQIGTDIVIPITFAGVKEGPDITVLTNGGFAISWVDVDSNERGISVQGFDANGQAVGSAMRVNSVQQGAQVSPTITYLTDGGFVVAWSDRGTGSADSWEVKAQRFDFIDGTKILSGSGDFAAISLDESTNFITDVNAISSNTGAAIQYSIAGGADASLFSIDAQTGILTFVNAPDYEAPQDADGNNVYEVIVQASDGASFDNQSILVTVGNVNEGVMFTSSPVFTTSENALSIGTIAATDIDGDALIYSIAGGADAALFNIDAQTGALSFINAPDYENPGDADGNNAYVVTVRASDGTLSETQTLTVTVGNANEGLTITSGNSFGVVENQTAIGTVTASDVDGDAVTYSISGGDDAARFTIDAATGVLSFINAPNFESPSDVGANNVYDVVVTASDGSLSASQSIAVTVGNVNEGVTFTSSASFGASENNTAVGIVSATDVDGDAVTYSISGGADASRFTINATTGILSFVSAPNFESPSDAGANNVYDIIVTASDGSLSSSQAIAVAVGNVNEAVTITSNGGGNEASLLIVENSAGVTTVAATDLDGTAVSYAIVGGADASRFTINAQTGALSFINAPNFEAPTDAGANNVYDVVVQASDGILTDQQALSVTVINQMEGYTITGTSSANTISTTATVSGQQRATAFEDTIYGLGGNDSIYGGGGNDYIDGGAGNDNLYGEAGADSLFGGTGADRFNFNAVSDSPTAAPDVILDFSRTETDKIILSAIDANVNASKDQKFSFIGTSAFSGVAGQLRYEQSGGNSCVMGDVNGDGVADFRIQVNGLHAFVAADFIL